MARPLKCPECGANIGLPDGSTVHVCVCPKCGESVVIPKATPPATGKRSSRDPALGGSGKASSKSILHGHHEEEEGYPWHVKVVSALAVLFIVCFPLYVFWPRDTWERDNRAIILALCSKADFLASQGKAVEAQQKYEEVVATIGDRQLVDEQIRQTVARTALAQGEAKAAALLRSGDWAGAEREYIRLLDFLKAAPSDDTEANSARHRATRGCREARIRVLEAEAARVAQDQDLPKAIAQYDHLLNYLQKQPADDPVVTEARRKAIGSKQNVEAALGRIRAEEERRRQEEEQSRLAEQLKREEEAQRALAEAQSRAAREQFFRSPTYAQMKSQADSLFQSLELDLAPEDSAWRAISKSSEAAVDLLGIVVRMEAAITGQDVSAEIVRVQTELSTDMVGETSAIRAIFKKDRAFLDLLGVWCKVLEKNHPGLCVSFTKAQYDLSLAMVAEDSAYRAQSAHLEACMVVLQNILVAEGFKLQADKVVSAAHLANVADTSAIRAATMNAEACVGLVLLLVEQRDKAAAANIRRDIVLSIVGEDSAVRAHSTFKQATAKGLYTLVTAGTGQ
jgi:predicted RNA-binding Zn-ribbon protein involved in translation (DUF1610 family)